MRPLSNPIQALSSALISFAFPPACLACSREGQSAGTGGVCAACWSSLPIASAPLCGSCGVPIAAPGAKALADPACGRCAESPPPIDGIRPAAIYSGSARTILRAFKYGGADYLAPHLAALVSSCLAGWAGYVVIPVPATRREIREKGYFPAGLLARGVADRMRLPFSSRVLRKVRETARQTTLDLGRRHRNVATCFASDVAPESVLLIDDVATSGATLFACARALRRGGARLVLAGVFARAVSEAA